MMLVPVGRDDVTAVLRVNVSVSDGLPSVGDPVTVIPTASSAFVLLAIGVPMVGAPVTMPVAVSA